jgi:glycosyltransferase involved in cell wall biosynthesis
MDNGNQKKSILHIVAGLGYGGNEAIALKILQAAQRTTNNYLIVLDLSKQEQHQTFSALTKKVIYGKAGLGYIDIFNTARQTIQQTQPTAIISYTFNIKFLPIVLAAKLSGIHNIKVQVGNTAPAQPIPRRKWSFLLWCFSLLQVPVYPCSQAVMTSIETLAPLHKDSRVMINGCDIQAIATTAAKARAQRPANDKKRIVMVARLDAIKDQTTLLQAFAQLQPRYPDWELWLVGEGLERQRLEQLVLDLNLDPQTIFLGQRGDIPEILGQCDIFAFSTTEAEGFGIVLIEAMAAGLPIVASDVGACREVLLGGKAGILVEPKDIQAWVNALDSLMADDQFRQHISQLSVATVPQYDVCNTAQKWLELLCPRVI